MKIELNCRPAFLKSLCCGSLNLRRFVKWAEQSLSFFHFSGLYIEWEYVLDDAFVISNFFFLRDMISM